MCPSLHTPDTLEIFVELTKLFKAVVGVTCIIRAVGPGTGELLPLPTPDFDRLLNPISTRGAYYAHHITTNLDLRKMLRFFFN